MDEEANDETGIFCFCDDLRKKPLKTALRALAWLLIISGFAFLGYILIDDPDLKFGTMKFSMDPIVHTGFDVGVQGPAPMPPPAFNVTLHARNTHKHKYCARSATVRVAYTDVVIAIARMDPFCVEAKETTVLTGSASPGWPVLPLEFRERVHRDKSAGGVQIEVDVKFYSDMDGSMWVRCRSALDAKEASPCKFFTYR